VWLCREDAEGRGRLVEEDGGGERQRMGERRGRTEVKNLFCGSHGLVVGLEYKK
jgi:hypothetical protein